MVVLVEIGFNLPAVVSIENLMKILDLIHAISDHIHLD
jgi:hypothetical protein